MSSRPTLSTEPHVPSATGPVGSPSHVPTFETDRLLLRGIRGDDFEAMVGFYADPISRYYGGPCNRQEAWRKFAAFPGHWMLRGYGPWTLESKTDGSVVGICGPWYPDGWIEPEITWALVPDHHGRGFATEAAERAITVCYEHFGWDTAVSVISTNNHASIAVAERLGASREGAVDNRYGPADVYRHRPPNPVQPHPRRTPK